MATSDMRLSLDFVDHPKVRKLIRKAGYEGFFSLIKLFSMAGKIYQKGVLKDLESEDIEALCEWRGEGGKFVDSMVDVGFLEKSARGYEIHDWEQHQPWIFHCEVRSEQAKNAARARWDAVSMPDACAEHANSNAPSPIPTPIPTPNPIPIPKNKKQHVDDESVRLASLLLEKSRAYDPKIAIGKDKQTIASWAKDIDKLIRIDKRTADEVESVILWCKSKGNFWIPNILSGKKLREKFPTLFSQMQTRGGRGQKALGRASTESGSLQTSPDDYGI